MDVSSVASSMSLQLSQQAALQSIKQVAQSEQEVAQMISMTPVMSAPSPGVGTTVDITA